MTNATAPSGPVEPLLTSAQIGEIAQETDADIGYFARTGDTLIIGTLIVMGNKVQRIYEQDRAATAERVEALERSLSVGDALYHGAVDVVAKLDDEIASLKQALAESRRLLAEANSAIVELYDALNTRDNCPTCGGDGTNWTEIGGEAEPDNCDCANDAYDQLLKHGKLVMTLKEMWRADGATSGGQQDE